MIARFRIDSEVFSSLAAGGGDVSTIRFLRDVWQSEHLLLLRFLVQAVGDRSDELAAAYQVLSQVQERAPQIVRDLLALPWVGVWAVRCARRVRGAPRMTAALREDLSYLAAIATVAGIHSGSDVDLPIRLRGGRLVLPGLGAARVASAAGPARLLVRDGTVAVLASGQRISVTDSAGWQGLRRLDASPDGQRLVVALDDLDPYRNCYTRPVSPRLSERTAHRWQGLFSEAWELLVRYAPDRARELAAGLAAVVPLSSRAGAPGLSVTSENAFGALALTPPFSAAAFAATLVHEFQHSKLGALWRLVPLYNRKAAAWYYVPWRDDPRPISGLLQGAYAFLAVADVWRLFRADPSTKDIAEQEFANLRVQIRQVLDTLDGSGRLTAEGKLFLAHMRVWLERMFAEPVPPRVAQKARDILNEKRLGWAGGADHP